MDLSQVCRRSQGGSMWGTGRKMAPKLHWRMLLLSCIGIALLLVCPPANALRQTGNSSLLTTLASPPAGTEVKGQSLVCPAASERQGTPAAPVTKVIATLSEAQPSVSLQCGSTTTVVPKDLAQGKVCPGDLEGKNLTTCEQESSGKDGTSGAGKSPISLSELMGGVDEKAVTWTAKSAEGGSEAGGMIYTLALPAAPLPLLDGTFLTGCLNTKNRSEEQCVLTVNVEARKSAASGQTVSCAYGKKSNPANERPTVTITPENNTLTLACGHKDATTIPENLSVEYCMDTGACTKKEKYETLIPGFESSWWVKDQTGLAWTLTIPKNKVPSSPHTIHVGCVYQPKPEEQNRSPGEGVPTATACMADVIIGGESSAAGPSGATVLSVTLVAVALSFSFSRLS